jgi:peptidoglycan/LPS O-acetylase OafA/YrhL
LDIPRKEREFRPEIQGLRAVAATLVAVYHIWLGRVSGGVDVFFVVSGFLITKSLIGQASAHGHIALAAFWGGLAKRLLPAACFVLVAVALASTVWLPKARWADTIKEIVASGFYVVNWRLAFDSVDYLARDEALSPVQHFWALSVQGQVYLLWPILVSLVLLGIARDRARFRTAFTGVLLAVFAGSLAYSVIATRDNQPFAYFNTLARVWEFALGGLLAVLLPTLRLPAAARVWLGWIGIAAILSCGLVLQVSSVFPGYAALWPTLGAAFVIAAGTSGSGIGADRILASRPLAYLGDISYSLYLWHWPLLIFYRIHVERTHLALHEGLGVLAVALVLAALTTRFVENPVRFSRIGAHKPSHALALGAACLGTVVFAAALWTILLLHLRGQDSPVTRVDDPNYPGAHALDDAGTGAFTHSAPIRPGPFAVRNDLPPIYADGCHQETENTSPLRCDYGNRDADQMVALVGGSHAAHWLPALQVIAEREDWRIVTFTKSSCLFSAGPQFHHDGRSYPECAEWNDNVMSELLRLRPTLVFTTSTTAQTEPESLPSGVLNAWRRLEQAGLGVVAIRDVPWMGFDVSECVDRKGSDSLDCTRRRDEVLAAEDPVAALSTQPKNVHFVDLSRYFCTDSTCLPVAGNIMIYRDRHHITASYARSLADVLQQEMDAARRKLVKPDLAPTVQRSTTSPASRVPAVPDRTT